jgi:DNA-binding transcriptional MerR regulator
MRVSQLVEQSGVPLATVKYYLREGLLMQGEATSATRAEYGPQHLRRLVLIKALSGLGLPIPRVREILSLIDEPRGPLVETLGAALSALPPYPEAGGDHPRARAVLEKLGQSVDPDYPAVAQLEHALAAAEAVGMPLTDDRLQVYGEHIAAVARAELADMPQGSVEDAIEYAVLGTAIYEPVLAAMRRLAHQDLATKMFPEGEPE